MRIALNAYYFLPGNAQRFAGQLRAAVSTEGGSIEIVVSESLGAALVGHQMAKLIDAEQLLDPEPE